MRSAILLTHGGPRCRTRIEAASVAADELKPGLLNRFVNDAQFAGVKSEVIPQHVVETVCGLLFAFVVGWSLTSWLWFSRGRLHLARPVE